MRVLAVIALAMLLAGCEGDRIKQSKNPLQKQRHFGLLAQTVRSRRRPSEI
jgi:hypothetical protein